MTVPDNNNGTLISACHETELHVIHDHGKEYYACNKCHELCKPKVLATGSPGKGKLRELTLMKKELLPGVGIIHTWTEDTKEFKP